MSARILVAEDDRQIRDVLDVALTRSGHRMITARTGPEALQRAASDAPDLLILDIGLPGMDGLEVCRSLRRTSDVPILFLTARDDEVDRIVGLELGADDYVTKPFSPRELTARVAAILKRTAPGRAGARPRHRGVLTFDAARHAVTVDDVTVDLTGTERRILGALMDTPDRVVRRPDLVDAVWGAGAGVSDRTLDSHLRNLRAKLDAAGVPDAIDTLHGVGLRMGPCRGA